MKNIKPILFAGMMSLLASSVQAADNSPNVYLNGTVAKEVVPIMRNGSTLVPLKAVSSLLGATTHWDSKNKQVTVIKGETINTLTINEKVAHKQEGAIQTIVQLAAPAIVENGATYVPLRYIAESLDVKVDWVSQSQSVYLGEGINYKGKTIHLGSDLEEIKKSLGDPDLSLSDGEYDLLFYTKDADETMIFYMLDNELTGFCTNARSFAFRNYTYNAAATIEDKKIVAIKDQMNNHNIVALGYNIRSNTGNSTSSALLKANERVVVALTNGFRAHNGVEALNYNEQIATIARSHSKDMATANYFNHTNLQGVSASERLTNGGINWKSCAENIAAGMGLGIEAYGQWLNSVGHRENMLKQTGDIGVGAAYSSSSTYGYYYTQNFAKVR